MFYCVHPGSQTGADQRSDKGELHSQDGADPSAHRGVDVLPSMTLKGERENIQDFIHSVMKEMFWSLFPPKKHIFEHLLRISIPLSCFSYRNSSRANWCHSLKMSPLQPTV